MSSQNLRPVLSRWETSPPVIHAAEARGDFRHIFKFLGDQSLVRRITPAGSTDCTECGQRCRVRFITDELSDKHGFIDCRHCGIAEVPDHLLQRWEIDTGDFLTAAFSGVTLSV